MVSALPKTIRTLRQVGRSNYKRDFSRYALTAGKRISRNGAVYWETRRNRSDVFKKRI